jgi:hypothetical protein
MLSRMKLTGTTWLVVAMSALAGCSLLYSPNNLPAPAIDSAVPIDAAIPPDLYVTMHPDLLALDTAGPLVLFEGQGTGGSRPAILVIKGSNIADDATVALLPAGGQASMIEIDNAHAAHAPGVMAVPVTLPIDTSRGTTGKSDVALTVQVTQMAPPGAVETTIVKALEGQVVLRNLPELDMPITSSASLAPLYSRVRLSVALSFAASTAGRPAVIRAVSSIELGDVHADGNGATPGTGGAGGGATQAAGGGPGGGRPGTLVDLAHLALLVAGSGGGFGETGFMGAPSNPGGAASGEELLVSYASNASSGGGGGGANAGGGGGGTLELTAGGTLTTGKVTANGGRGGDGALLAGAAGGGSGGAIVLRSGGPAKLGTVSASGGPGGTTTQTGGDGGAGRLRYDVPSFVGATPMMPSTSRRGAAFVEGIPLITHDPRQILQLTSAVASDLAFKIFVLDADGITLETTSVMFTAPSVAIKPTLTVGYNRVCVTPPAGNPTILESTNCIDIAYVP